MTTDHRALPPSARAQLQALLDAGPRPGAVAFDADGTLWRGDVGEDLLRYLLARQLLPAVAGRPGVYEEYERRVAKDPADAYGWAVEIMAGVNETQLNEHCEQFFAQRYTGRVFHYVRPLLKALEGLGLHSYVVSASPVWAVIPGAKALGIAPERVVAVSSEVEQGVLTDRLLRPIPCGEGKVHALKARGVEPVLAVGNSELDLPMLRYAKAGWAVAPFGEGGNPLVHEANRLGWPVIRA
ncbi:MAG: haloacid dehalogenase-like hydrolase [Myxococcaceae bacterium]|nr:haloacid dehalogenase-like hydrolase [Myxococcaceae bacterium]